MVDIEPMMSDVKSRLIWIVYTSAHGVVVLKLTYWL